MRTALGVLLGFLCFQVIALRLYPMITDHLGEQAYEKAFGELGRKLERLRMAGYGVREAIDSYYRAYGVVPVYASDLDCSAYHRCEGVRQAGGIFFIEADGFWMAIEPRLEPGHSGVVSDCGVSLDEDMLFGTILSNCKPLGASFAPTFPSPPFDCTAAKSSPERLICASDRLTALELELSHTYTALMQRASPAKKKQIAVEQVDFIRKRDESCTDATCVERRVRARLSELNGYTPDANRKQEHGI